MHPFPAACVPVSISLVPVERLRAPQPRGGRQPRLPRCSRRLLLGTTTFPYWGPFFFCAYATRWSHYTASDDGAEAVPLTFYTTLGFSQDLSLPRGAAPDLEYELDLAVVSRTRMTRILMWYCRLVFNLFLNNNEIMSYALLLIYSQDAHPTIHSGSSKIITLIA